MKSLYDWYDTPDSLTLVFYIKSHDQHSFSYTISNTDTKVGTYFHSPFLNFKLPYPLKSHYIITDSYKIQVKLVKLEPKKWANIFNDHKAFKHSRFDIEYVDDTEKNIEDFFMELYSNASDNVKMAMDKSILESRGTVLTTCWRDVENRKVEPVDEYVIVKEYDLHENGCNK